MTQNRNKLIALLIGNLLNAVLHEALERAIQEKAVANRYHKELLTSFHLARKYREKIHPIDAPLPSQDTAYIKERVMRRVKAELRLRIAKGYQHIDVRLVEPLVEKHLREMKVID